MPTPLWGLRHWGAPTLLAWVAGHALQLEQGALWDLSAYLGLLGFGLGAGTLGGPWRGAVLARWRTLAWPCAALALAFGGTGLRALAQDAERLTCDAQTRDWWVTGVVADMPQRGPMGWRFRFDVEGAAQPVGTGRRRLSQPCLRGGDGVEGGRAGTRPLGADGTPAQRAGTAGEAMPATQAVQGEPKGRAAPVAPVLHRLLLSWWAPSRDAAVLSGDGLPELRAGDRWRFVVRLKQPHGARNPHGFDQELWMWEQGLQATGQVRPQGLPPGRRQGLTQGRDRGPEQGPHEGAGPGAASFAPQRLGPSGLHPVERARQRVRDRIERQLQARPSPAPTGAEFDESAGDDEAAPSTEPSGLPPAQRMAGIVAALLVGDQAAIAASDWDLFRLTGVAHLMSISGLHVTLFAWVAARVAQALWRRSARACLWWPAPRVGTVAGVGLALAYAVFSGWGVPAQRTVWMLVTVAVLRWRSHDWPWTWTWLLTCAVVVTVDPWALRQAGFWLSFVAVGALFATSPPRRWGHAGPKEAQGPGHVGRWRTMGVRARTVVAHAMHEQGVVTLALTPLAVLWFGQVSVVGLLANAVAIPLVTGVVTPLAFAGLVWPGAWSVAAALLGGLWLLLDALAGLSWAVVHLPVPPLWAAVAGVLGGAVLTMPWPPAWRSLGLAALLPALLWETPRPPEGEFDLLAADVGQGNAVLVRTARHSLLYDSGPRYHFESDAGQRVLLPLLRAHGETAQTLGLMVISHRDSDHSGGALSLWRAFPSLTVLTSMEALGGDVPQQSHHAPRASHSAPGALHPVSGVSTPALGAADPTLGVPSPVSRDATSADPSAPRVVPCLAGQHWRWDGVDFAVLHPTAADLARAPRPRPNALSCVLRVASHGATGRRVALLLGDLEAPQEAALIARDAAALRSVDLLLMPHHGSKTSSSPALLDQAAPRLSVVQAGHLNRFGHPAAEVMARYDERGLAVEDTAQCGALAWSSVLPHAACERRLRPRYWAYRAEGARGAADRAGGTAARGSAPEN